MDFSRLLSKTWKAGVKDNATFGKWEDKEISTEECIEEFKQNNYIDYKIKIKPEEFVRWLNGLGWKRYEG